MDFAIARSAARDIDVVAAFRCANTGNPLSRSRHGQEALAARATISRCAIHPQRADRGTVAGRHQRDRGSGRPASRRPCAGIDGSRGRSGNCPSRRAGTLRAGFQHKTPASAATLGRLSRSTATTPTAPHAFDHLPFGRLPACGSRRHGVGISRTVAMPIRIACPGLCQRQAVDEGAGRAELRTSATSSHWPRGWPPHRREWRAPSPWRAIFLLRRGQRKHPRCGAAPAASSFIKAGKSPLPSMAFRTRSCRFSFLPFIRLCSSMEIADLRRQGHGMG